MGRASIIEAYIQQLIAWKQPITSSILAAIANEVGITRGELESINRRVQVHLSRSHSCIEYGNFNQAIDELTQAKALDPVNLEVLRGLAYAYNLRYQKDSHLSDKRKALSVAKRCVELNPDDPEALALIKGLEGRENLQTVSLQTKPNIFILMGFLENIFSPQQISRRTKTKIAVLILFLQQPIDPAIIVRWTTMTMAIVTGGVATAGLTLIGLERLSVVSKPVSEAVVSAPVFDPGPNIPVSFNYPGLLIEPRLSRLGEYDGEDYYKLHGIVINDSGQDVRKLNLKVELLNGDGVAISSIEQVALSNAIIRPGDTHSFNLFHKITPALISVRVSVVDIEQVVENKTYSQPVNSIGDEFASQGGKLISHREKSDGLE